MEEKDIILRTSGMGIIIYSNFAVKKIVKGENFLVNHYWDYTDVLKEVNSGGILGVCLENPGEYIFKIREGIPLDDLADNTKFKLRLSLKVSENTIFIRDLYDLMYWDEECDKSQIIKIEDGYYTVLMLGNMPNIGYFGDSQTIYMHFVKDQDFNTPKFKGIPNFRDAGKKINVSEFLDGVL